MGRLPDRTESAEMEAIERMIRHSAIPKTSMSGEIMDKIGEMNMSRTRKHAANNGKVWKRTVVAASAAAILGGGIIGSGFVSPAMAEALKQVPVFGTIFKGTTEEAVKAAMDQGLVKDPNLSVTHDGVTLKLRDLLYDGTRLSFVLDREGVDLENTIAPFTEQEKPEDQLPKGYIKTGGPKIFIDGKEFNNKEATSLGYGDFPPRDNALRAEWQLNDKTAWGNEFELTIRTEVTGVDESFEFKVPMKIADNAVLLKPNATKTYEDFSYTVNELVITPVTTRLVIDSTGKVPRSAEQTGDYIASMMYYDIVDDQGNLLTQNKFGYFHSEPKTEYHVDELYSPFNGTPKSITIKPFTLTVNKNDWSVVGEGKDSNGTYSRGDKTYIKELEVTIPVEK
ncbi:DUF4179 domain-containing protein [Paenibacillus macerans]|uniref:DUF4179 domain-containing protein n=1 Tax=Paenibacillus macerans TaxID=44252 RepID=A0A6N8F5W7_PAEMA|nr:DUF4179 domain-containing protein [Paenibacillus macerans]MUG25832.1 DUF4179 domain-containing protein [Paenibacillus macerans]UMV50684.1 DUF4179 domain-containing protein [Paenibacillus macerans]